MAENEAYVPSLTLNPTQAATQAAPAWQPVAEQTAPAPEPEKLDIERLSPQEQEAVRQFAKQIDVTDTNLVLSYGAAAQKNISDFSGQALGKVRTKDLGEVGDALSDLVVELKGLNEDEKQKGFLGLFKKAEKNIAATKAKYDKAEVNVDKITAQLQNHQMVLSKDIASMDKMFELNQAYFKELTMYIIAGKLRAQELREKDLKEYQDKALKSGLPEDAQAANDFANLIGRFEKKLHDLELTRMISLQMGPQIRMIQNNDLLMTEKIQTAIVNTIPLWKQQMVLALSMYHSQQAMEASHAVSQVTNDLLVHNAEALHMGSIEVAKESERGIVDLETLKKTNQHLIDTLQEVKQIQDDGRARRAEAELELGRIEGELKQKLLDMQG
ncbi:MAG: toxic anion resistance protein [Oscillospiraceae bacterium]|nr:toxic anion resistance protein [Oscillospiraceae bacterium]MBR6209412.1 toxic anion resistance protein [Oscillospiraceae bacterium]